MILKNNSRRGFFKQSATVAAGLGTLTFATCSSKKIAAQPTEYKLKLVSWYEPDFLNQFSMTQRLADRAALLSDGRLKLDVIDPNNAGFPREEIFQKVSDGTIDMGRTLSYYWNKPLKRPLDFFLTIPFGLTQKEFTTWLYYLDGQALWDEVYDNYGVKPFLCGSLDAQSFGWFKQEISSVQDLKGLKYRTTGPMVDIMQQVGAKPVNLGGDGIIPALREGRIDGAELVGPAADIQFGFEEVAPYQYWPGFHQPMGGIELIVN
ncbi:MAG: ABC transporter substrate-binding protein, partial [Cyanobacteriota bacterium]|nr:ABC transporter substrate-binding protein [Cyanobacteriota bacterium]